MNKREIIKQITKERMSFIYNNWNDISEDQKKELILCALDVLRWKNLTFEYVDELEIHLLED